MEISQPGPAVSGVVTTSRVPRLAVAAYLARFKGQSASTPTQTCAGIWCGVSSGDWTAASQSPNRCDFAPVTMLGLLGLRIFEATGSDIDDLGEQHGHRVLRVHRKGDKIVLVPLPAGREPGHRAPSTTEPTSVCSALR